MKASLLGYQVDSPVYVNDLETKSYSDRLIGATRNKTEICRDGLWQNFNGGVPELEICARHIR